MTQLREGNERRGAVMDQLRGELVADCGSEDGEHPRVLGDALLIGLPFDQRGHVAGDSEVLLDRFCHGRDGTASATMSGQTKRGGSADDTPPPATGGWS
jgi:hypothetical protein